MKTTKVPINRRINKEHIVCIQNGVLLSYKKDEAWSSVTEWKKPKGMRSKLSQKEKDNTGRI